MPDSAPGCTRPSPTIIDKGHRSLLWRIAGLSLATALVSVVRPQAGWAQAYPTKPVRVVTTEPGSANDVVARMIAPKLTQVLGQQLLVDNRGIIAGEIVSRAAPDGYTLLSYGSPL